MNLWGKCILEIPLNKKPHSMDFAEMLPKLVARAGQNRKKMGILAVKNADRLTL